MARPKRKDEYVRTSLTFTASAYSQAQKIMSGSNCWKRKMTSISSVVEFALDFICENYEQINDCMTNEEDKSKLPK